MTEPKRARKSSRKKPQTGPHAKSQKEASSSYQAKEDAAKESLLRRYYPVFESLILFILDYAKWWRALQGFLKDELDYRSGLALQALVWFVTGSALLVFSLLWLLLGAFFGLRLLTGSDWISALAVGGIFFFLGLFFLNLMLKISRRIFDANTKKTKGHKKDDWLYEGLEDP